VTLGTCAVIAGLALAACAGPSGSGAGANSPVKVGYLLPLTGVFTSNGTTEENGFKLGLKTFGSSVDGHPIDVTYLNTQGQPTVALSDAAQLMTRDRVQLVEGPLVSSETAVVAPDVLNQGTMEDDLYLASPGQMAAYTKYHMGFTSDWNGYQPTSVGAAWAYNTMHWRHVTVVGLNISYGWQGIGGFETEFKKLGGTLDKSIWVPSDAVEMSSYVSSVPSGTQAVFVVLSGSQAANFVNTYAQFGLKGKVPLMGITTLTDQAALPAEHAPAALGVYTAAQYCDDLPSAVNQTFANSYRAAYGAYPSYYSEAGYTKAQILVKALQSLRGQVTSEAALARAMDQVKITAPRGPVTISPVTHSPVENEYICKVENVGGALRNVPIVTYPNVQPWGTLPESVFETAFASQSSGPPS
jgi:branched-chain amino acid transport system substrate-binding protein